MFILFYEVGDVHLCIHEELTDRGSTFCQIRYNSRLDCNYLGLGFLVSGLVKACLFYSLMLVTSTCVIMRD
jgi:hypothetical protein